MTYRVIRGDWMRDGYIDNPVGQPGRLVVRVVDGVAYDAELYDAPCGRPSWPNDCALKVAADGEIRAWGHSTSFAPDAGEVERVGIR